MEVNKTLFDASIEAAKNLIEKQYPNKILEMIQFFFDFENETLTCYFKFQNDNGKFAANATSLKDKDEKAFASAMLDGIKKELPLYKGIDFADLYIDVNKKTVKKVSIYYTDILGRKRIFEN